MSNSPQIKTAMISSTALDLPEHRKQVMDACSRAGFIPLVMEQLPARDADAIRVSLEMVDQARVYIGIFAWRYGYRPDRVTSITEMEFNRAIERQKAGELDEILVFTPHASHAITFDMVEREGDAPEKLEALKQRACEGRSRAEFKSPEDLRGLVLHALVALEKRTSTQSLEPTAPKFHRDNIIPTAPEPYIAHPYSLLQTEQVVGRQAELNLLTDWVTANRQVPANVRLFNLVAIGGMGKSALTWKWFNDIAPHELPNRAGWMWWSFYESDAHYENFIIRALAYTSGQSEQDVRQLTQPDREDRLWRLLDEQPFVIVLDGLERILLAYARMDASRMLDDDLDERTANYVARSIGLPDSAGQSFISKHQLRQTADQRAGQFLRRLTRVRASRMLISTRLYPTELQAETGDPLSGCIAYFVTGLTDDDALNLWREFKVSGSREELLPLFKSFGNYPLLIRALAGEVASYRAAPRDFDKWRADNPDFNPAALPLKNAKTHVLEYALRGLGETQRKVLHTLAAFRMPATWDTLRALLVEAFLWTELPLGSDSQKEDEVAPSTIDKMVKPCADDRVLDAVLTELEDRGLMGWDKQANRYDLHPIVRGVVWATLAPDSRHELYSQLHTYFEALPRPPDWEYVESLDELTPAVELFDKLIRLERYEDAVVIFRDHLHYATLYRLSASLLRVELLERFFVDGVAAPPRLEANWQAFVMDALGAAYHHSGEPGRAALLVRRALDIVEHQKHKRSLANSFENLAFTQWFSGQLWVAQIAGRRALLISRELEDRFSESVSCRIIGAVLAACGQTTQSEIALRRSLVIADKEGFLQVSGSASADSAQRYLLFGQAAPALVMAQRAWELAREQRLEGDFIHSARLHGEAALGVGDYVTAEERLHHALTRARAVNFVEEELPAITALADLHRQRGQYDDARELLEQIWAAAERGPYPLRHSDARNVLARIERDRMKIESDVGRNEARLTSIAAATRAFELAWCDGPPYAYHYGLTNAKQLLTELGAQDVIAKLEAELPPFDESKFEPMPDVELNPKDEFWVDPDTLDSDT